MSNELYKTAKSFFTFMDKINEATQHLAYDSALHLKTEKGYIVVQIRQGKIVGVTTGEVPVGYWDLLIETDEKTLMEILSGAISPGTALYSCRLTIPEEKSKHNIVVALFQAIRVTQEHLPRLGMRSE